MTDERWIKPEQEGGRGVIPRRFLTDEEVGLVNAKADLGIVLSDVPITQRRKGSKEEGAGCGQVGDGQADVRDGHCDVQTMNYKGRRVTL